MRALDIHVHHRWTDPDRRPDYQLERLRTLARQSGIERVLALSSGMGCSPDEVRQRNNCTLRLVEEEPGFYLGAMYLSPNHEPDFTQAEARRCAEAGMVAIKQGHETNARSERIDPIARAAVELDIPILFHAWYKVVDKKPEESDASDIADLARRHPDARIIVAHLTGVGRRGVQDVEDLPNVWIDTCGGWYDTEMVEYAVRRIGAERIVYGSDYVGRDFAPQLGRVLGARLSDEDKEKIVWSNAAGLLELE